MNRKASNRQVMNTNFSYNENDFPSGSVDVSPELQKFYTKPRLSSLGSKAEKMFALLGVKASEDVHLRIFDSIDEGNVILVHYISLSPTVYHVRGVVIDVVNERILCSSFPYTEEYTVVPPETTANPESLQFLKASGKVSFSEDCIVTKAYEGTILRLFSYKGTWYLSTHKKLDGSKSRWAGPPFGMMFDSIWGKDVPKESIFDPEKCYVLLMSHPDNKLVCDIRVPKLYVVASYSRQGEKLVRDVKTELKTPTLEGAPTAVPIYRFRKYLVFLLSTSCSMLRYQLTGKSVLVSW